jgi:hypothetical protein
MLMRGPSGLQFFAHLGLLVPSAKRVARGAGALKDFDETC